MKFIKRVEETSFVGVTVAKVVMLMTLILVINA